MLKNSPGLAGVPSTTPSTDISPVTGVVVTSRVALVGAVTVTVSLAVSLFISAFSSACVIVIVLITVLSAAPG